MSKPSWQYTSSVGYAQSLAFDYIETFSFQRGAAFEQTGKMLKYEFDLLKSLADSNSLAAEQKERFAELEADIRYTQYLVSDKGKFHFSAEKTNTFQYGDAEVELLLQILKTEIIEIPRFLCAPFYRDAIVFYRNDGSIVSVLNVCLSCKYMETEAFSHINADFETYDLLKRWFIKTGHDVERPDYFVMNKIRRLKEKKR